MTRKERKKIFSRFLKELGIYSIWIAERKKKYRIENVFDVVYDNDNLGDIIDFSFSWCQTKNPGLWSRLNIIGENYEIKKLCKHEEIQYIKNRLIKDHVILKI